MQIGVETSRAVDNKRIFVVDSEEITRAVLQFMLHDENETHEIPSLEAAYAKAADWKPDVILLGITIIRHAGVGVIATLRERIPGTKIAIVCDSAADETAKTCLAQGADSLLAKPLTIEGVRRKVDVLLGRRAALRIPVEVA